MAYVVGQIGWIDLTVPDAVAVRDFYAEVTGWKISPVEMGGYQDFCMNVPSSGESVAGICHARAMNAGLPPVWLMYITVANLDESMKKCVAGGGKIRTPARSIHGMGRFCVIEDPAGAAAALVEPEGGAAA